MSEHKHCWHDFRGPTMMVVPDGHVVQKCCDDLCMALRVVHAEHASERADA